MSQTPHAGHRQFKTIARATATRRSEERPNARASSDGVRFRRPVSSVRCDAIASAGLGRPVFRSAPRCSACLRCSSRPIRTVPALLPLTLVNTRARPRERPFCALSLPCSPLALFSPLCFCFLLLLCASACCLRAADARRQRTAAPRSPHNTDTALQLHTFTQQTWSRKIPSVAHTCRRRRRGAPLANACFCALRTARGWPNSIGDSRLLLHVAVYAHVSCLYRSWCCCRLT